MQDRRRRSRRRRVWLWLLLIAVALLLLWCRREAPLVLGTFNIQTFPHGKTDREAVAAALAELDADALAVQEIRDLGLFQATLDRASALAGRRYAAVLTPSCRGRRDGRRLHVGVVYDTARLELADFRALSKGDSCPMGQAPGLVASLRAGDGRTLALASVHFTPNGDDRSFRERQGQWKWLASILPALREELGAEVVVGGDFNSTGYDDEKSAERRFIDELVAKQGLQLPTSALGCSMYWKTRGRWEPSLLDHVLAPKDMSFGTPEALGMCAALACEVQSSEPEVMRRVSDHCPVRIELRE
ncbi:endonuclease/exonuclease/phosphatase family protein [Nannocystis radixulma]|uniref:Endonuclease/exonuclease/phosphatase family protein n=1 Tax=Nannocystis radixulma TaxID=2995305 RepID=A0ABT5B3T9_9BACT|nr:endonuclease/exonuclease/phosphatase family protein [Nannocystis radixulma]MDC0668764.1 endonuclease/exonuclease/phosphatase family protein [Nannocystis radixulma]